MRGERAHGLMIGAAVVISNVMFVIHCVLYLLLPPKSPTITLRTLLFISFFPQSLPFVVCLIRRSGRSANHPSTRPSTTQRHFISLSSSLVFSRLCDIHDGPSSSECPSLSEPQQDSEGFRSERERHDEATRSRQEHCTERYLESARVDRFRTSVPPIRACLKALAESWTWMCGSRFVADFEIG